MQLYENDRVMLLKGDCLERLQGIDDDSIDALVTDPPAGIAFMNKRWDKDKGGRDAWIAWMCEVMRECLRVLKPGAHGLVWALPRTSHWTATALEDAGFELREIVSHIFGTGFPKSLNVSKALSNAGHSTEDVARFEGWGTSLKPAQESWILCSKPLTQREECAMLLEETETILFRESLWQKLNVCVNDAASISRSSNLKQSGESSVLESAATRKKEKTETANAAEKSSTRGDLRSSEVTADSAHTNAATLRAAEKERRTPTGTADGSQEQTVTCSSEPTASMFWNTVSSWKESLADLLNVAKMSTISTETSPTTDLRTLNSALIQATSEITTDKSEIQKNGALSFALSVDCLLKNALTKLSTDAMISVLESASCNAEHSTKTPQKTRTADLATNAENSKATKPSTEFWHLVRKPLGEKTVAANCLKYGTGALNIGATRVPTNGRPSIESKSVETVTAFGDGLNGSRANGTTTQGRYPAHLILSHAPDCTDDSCGESCPIRVMNSQFRETNSTGGDGRGESSSVFGMDGAGCITKGGKGLKDAGGVARYFLNLPPFIYQPKASKSDRNAGLDERTEKKVTANDRNKENNTPYLRDATPRKNTHPTVKSTHLMSYLCKLITPIGGTVLDPFMGSGSTGVSAVRENFNFIGIEREDEYFEIAVARITHEQTQNDNADETPQAPQQITIDEVIT